MYTWIRRQKYICYNIHKSALQNIAWMICGHSQITICKNLLKTHLWMCDRPYYNHVVGILQTVMKMLGKPFVKCQLTSAARLYDSDRKAWV